MGPALSSNEMRNLEKAAFASGRVSSRALMEFAGKGVADEILQRAPSASKEGAHALVLCGPGNNGGDGFVIARHLAENTCSVQVLFYGTPDRLSPDARFNYDLWVKDHAGQTHCLRFSKLSPDDTGVIREALEDKEPLIIVDALFGIGLDRPLTTLEPLLDGHARRRAEHPEPDTFCVAVDVPSGLSDNGPVSDRPNSIAQADLTVTFHCLKKAHLAAPEFCGKVIVKDIGL